MAELHTPDTVKAQLQADIVTANNVTGKADTTIHDAMLSLAEKYGVGNPPVLQELTVTENGEYTPPVGVDGFSKVIAEIEVIGNSVYELIYETMFTLSESQVGVGRVDVATISTGLTQADWNNAQDALIIIKCENDTDPDTSYTHFVARTQYVSCPDIYSARSNTDSGTIYNSTLMVYGFMAGVYVKQGTPWFNSITLSVSSDYYTFGLAPSGDYSVKVFALQKQAFGLGDLDNA